MMSGVTLQFRYSIVFPEVFQVSQKGSFHMLGKHLGTLSILVCEHRVAEAPTLGIRLGMRGVRGRCLKL